MLMTVPTGSSDGEKSSVAMGIDLATYMGRQMLGGVSWVGLCWVTGLMRLG